MIPAACYLLTADAVASEWAPMMFPPCDCAAIDVTMSIHTTTISVDKVNHVISQETESVLESEGHRTPQKAVWREWASQPSSSTRAKIALKPWPQRFSGHPRTQNAKTVAIGLGVRASGLRSHLPWRCVHNKHETGKFKNLHNIGSSHFLLCAHARVCVCVSRGKPSATVLVNVHASKDAVTVLRRWCV